MQNGNVRILGIDSAPVTTFDRVLDMLPGVLEKVEGFVEKQQAKKAVQDEINE